MVTRPDYARVRDLVAEADPLLVAAVADVDLALLQWGMSLTPWERLRVSSEGLRFWSSFRRVAPDPS